ncbi:MAG: prefoldin subunit alpha [Candidatus Jordarchaeales archaeon]|nr:prefoldin subunit alpha [Candidatus Jordarchaeia archaeon]
MSENEQRFRATLSQLNVYEQQAQILEERLALLNQMIEETRRATIALDEIKSMDLEHEVLVSLGAGAFLKVKVAEKEKVIFQIGAGVVVEKSIDDVRAKLSERQGELQKELQATAQQLDAVVRRARELNRQLQELAVKVSEERGLK